MELARRIEAMDGVKEARVRKELASELLSKYFHACLSSTEVPIDIVDAIGSLGKSGVFDELTTLETVVVACHYDRKEVVISLVKQVASQISDIACREHIREMVSDEARGILDLNPPIRQFKPQNQIQVDIISAAKEYPPSKSEKQSLEPRQDVPHPQQESISSSTSQHAEQPALDLTGRAELEQRKNIYLQLKSSLSADEMAHRLMRTVRQASYEIVVSTLIEACYREKIYNPIFANTAHRLCSSNAGNQWVENIQEAFQTIYDTAHDLETSQLRAAGSFFGFLLAINSINLSVTLRRVELDPEQSTPSNRILLQSVFHEMQQELGKESLISKLHKANLPGLFPDTDNLELLRFSINFFTAIGLGGATKEMRSRLT